MKNIDLFLKKIMPHDKESVIVWHRLSQNKKIKEHFHKNYDEFVLIDNGFFEILINGKTKKYNLKNKFTIIKFPAKSKHAFYNGQSVVEYFVVRIKK